MSLVPYSNRDSREIVLRHEDAVVVRDPQSNQLVLRGASNHLRSNSSNGSNLSECPLCHQQIRSQSPERDSRNSGRSNSFVSPEYFRMLQTELNTPDNEYPPSSPIRRLVQPAYFPPNRAASPNVEGAEFVTSTPAQPSPGKGIKKDAFSPGYYKQFFKEEKELGRGGKGVVYLVRHFLEGIPLGYFACKRVPVGDDHAWLEKVLVEVQLLQNLKHANLVSYRHVWLEDFQPNRFGPSLPCAFILQEYCNGGDLLNHIIGDRPEPASAKEKLKDQMRRRSKTGDRPDLTPRNSQRRLNFDDIYSFFKDIASGLAHLHASNYIHRDLKPSNCLLHNDGSDTRCLISDFGEVQPENVVRKSTGATGTISYCAPEVLRRDATGRYGEFSTKSDIFSLGMILYFMCFGRLPYTSADAIQEELEDLEVLRAEISTWSGFRDERKERPDLPDQLYEFLKRLLSIDPMERPSASDILHAISSGSSLDTPPSTGRKGSIDHHLRIGKRIQNLDSPAPGTPSNLRSTSSAYIEDVGEDNQSPPLFREHHTHELQTEKSSDNVTAVRDSSRTPVQHLLLPPPLTRLDSIKHALVVYRHQAMSWFIRNYQISILAAKLIIFASKVYFLVQPCLPAASNPMITYPLLLLAAADLGLGQRLRWHTTVTLAFLHFLVIMVAVRRQALCLPERNIWDSD